MKAVVVLALAGAWILGVPQPGLAQTRGCQGTHVNREPIVTGPGTEVLGYLDIYQAKSRTCAMVSSGADYRAWKKRASIKLYACQSVARIVNGHRRDSCGPKPGARHRDEVTGVGKRSIGPARVRSTDGCVMWMVNVIAYPPDGGSQLEATELGSNC